MVIKPIRDIDLYFTNASWELATLGHYHELMERELPSLLSARGHAAWNGDGPAPGHIAIGHFHQSLVDSMLPSVLRGPLLLSLWAVYESTLIEMVEFLRTPAGLSFGLAERKVPKNVKLPSLGIIDRARHLYEVELRLSLFADQQMEAQVRGFYALRNVLAHAGGRRRSSKGADWRSVKEWASHQSGLDLRGDSAWIEAEFVGVQISQIGSATRHIVQQVRHKLHELGVAK